MHHLDAGSGNVFAFFDVNNQILKCSTQKEELEHHCAFVKQYHAELL